MLIRHSRFVPALAVVRHDNRHAACFAEQFKTVFARRIKQIPIQIPTDNGSEFQGALPPARGRRVGVITTPARIARR